MDLDQPQSPNRAWGFRGMNTIKKIKRLALELSAHTDPRVRSLADEAISELSSWGSPTTTTIESARAIARAKARAIRLAQTRLADEDLLDKWEVEGCLYGEVIDSLLSRGWRP